MKKTNAMRILESNHIEYNEYQVEIKEFISALDVSKRLNIDYHRVYKTLVTKAKSNNYYVFIIRADQELDLKKAALITNEKHIEMLKSKDLFDITGYIHGGCSPIGMKKQFLTFLDKSALLIDSLVCSGGRIGYFVDIKISDLIKITKLKIGDLAKEVL